VLQATPGQFVSGLGETTVRNATQPVTVNRQSAKEGIKHALGITACLYAYSNLSFGDGIAAGLTSTGVFAQACAEPQACAEHYHLLRECMLGHPVVCSILRAID